jgi:succinate-semialdehyde dehydrogenase/glutarate-semialdehyde dehydrogenase
MSIATVNPTTGETERSFEPLDATGLEARLAISAKAFGSYRSSPLDLRRRWLTSAAELLEGELPVFAHLMSTEMGKTFAAAKGEVAKCARSMRWAVDNVEQILADVPVPTSATRSWVSYRPIGPVLAVMPWNFPMWQVMRFAIPSLLAGNTCLLKHASNVPQTAMAIEDVYRRAGFPEGAFQTLLITAAQVADVVTDPRVKAVTLTGSEAAGRSVAATAGAVGKKSVLELGGSDPFIVLGSADVERAAAVAVEARVQNNGQSCIAAKRFIVHSEIYDRFTDIFVEKMKALVVGDPFDPATAVGPLALDSVRREVEALVDDAVSKGAQVRCGGSRLEGPGYFYFPTVIEGIDKTMRLATEEMFGPVASMFRVESVDEALEVANDTPFGLGASIWTEDPAEQVLFQEGLDVGMVFVNTMVASSPEVPFGGEKSSGYGRELGSDGFKEFCNVKTIWVA